MRLFFGVSLLVACSAQGFPAVDGGGSGQQNPQDAAVSDGTKNTTDADTFPALTAVYAVHAGAVDLPPFRVCVDPQSQPLPNDPAHPMPLSNFPGVAPGGMASLGNLTGQASATILDAAELNSSPTDKTSKCSMATTDGNLQYHHVVGSFTFQGGVQILVVYGPRSAPLAKLVSADTTTYAPGDPLHFQWSNFASSTPGMVDASFGPKGAPTEQLGTAQFGGITSSVKVTFMPSTAADYDTFGVVANGTFHSLTEIAHASDPTTTPGHFFGTRTSGYALVLVDDADSDAGKSQHIVGVPLAP